MALTISKNIITIAASALVGTTVPAAIAVLSAMPSAMPSLAASAPWSSARSSPRVAHESGVREQSAATRYWTPDRMRAVLRNAWADGDTMGSGLRWVHAGYAARTTGKVFFTLNGTDYVCSGSVVRGPGGRDVVLTAAHCVGDAAGVWATNWTFVPGYANGQQPYGAYTARRFFVSPHWEDTPRNSAAAEKWDIAFVTVNPSRGQSLGAATGAQAAVFGTKESGPDAYVFGYPSEPPFSGMYPNYCAGPMQPAARDGAVSMRCTMTAGDSGGPWFAGFSPRTGVGTIVAITTYKFSGGDSPLYGTMLGPDARRLYDQAVSSVRLTATRVR